MLGKTFKRPFVNRYRSPAEVGYSDVVVLPAILQPTLNSTSIEDQVNLIAGFRTAEIPFIDSDLDRDSDEEDDEFPP